MQTPPRVASTWPSTEVPIAERDHRHAVARAEADDRDDLLGAARMRDRVRGRDRVGRDVGSVMLADLARRRQAIAQERAQLRDQRLGQRVLVAGVPAQLGEVPGAVRCSLHDSSS